MPLFSVIAAHFVKNFDKHGQQGIHLCFADNIGFLVDIKENAFGGDGNRLSQRTTEHSVIAAFRQKQIEGGRAAKITVFHQQGQHFQKV